MAFLDGLFGRIQRRPYSSLGYLCVFSGVWFAAGEGLLGLTTAVAVSAGLWLIVEGPD